MTDVLVVIGIGGAEFNTVFGDLAKGKRNWQIAAFCALAIGFPLAGGLTAVATQSRITPYVVEVDQLGRAQAIGPADQMKALDQRVVVAQLARFVRDIRTVLGDPAGQADLIKRAYAFVDQRATPFLNEYFAGPANDPRILGKDFTRRRSATDVVSRGVRGPITLGFQGCEHLAFVGGWTFQPKPSDLP